MSAPHIHGTRRSFSVSAALQQLGDDLAAIRKEDGLTWKDVGRVLGKSDDRASDYANAISEMPVSAFLLGCREWNGRLGNGVMGMIGQKLSPVDAEEISDSDKLCRILKLAHLLSQALNDDVTPGAVDNEELTHIGLAALDDAARGIDALRHRLMSLSKTEQTALRAVGD
ncbi:MAG: hypothetical protein CL949_25120 [Erythrobacter sp.]|jgi:hypothetical protein|nr:hypothetical protein [Erythrobacter sp.]MBA4770776.1 hypothetical protein [Sphingobium sp.]